MSRRHIPITTQSEALRLARQGLSSGEIVTRLGGGMNRSTVTRWIATAGIAPHKPGPKPTRQMVSTTRPCTHSRITTAGKGVRFCADCGESLPILALHPDLRPLDPDSWIADPRRAAWYAHQATKKDKEPYLDPARGFRISNPSWGNRH